MVSRCNINYDQKREANFIISAEAVCNYIYNSGKSKSLELYKLLPQKRFSRLKHGSRRKRITIPTRKFIHNRDSIADDKKKVGHFEGYLTFHKRNAKKNHNF
jgi:IS30 family transposase